MKFYNSMTTSLITGCLGYIEINVANVLSKKNFQIVHYDACSNSDELVFSALKRTNSNEK